MSLNPVVLSIPIFFALMGLELVATAIKKQKLYRLKDAVTNVSLGIGSQLVGVFISVAVIAMYTFIYEYFAFFQMPKTWWSFLLVFVVLDFCYYWAHRYCHEVNAFWAAHVVHHQSEDYNLSVALRQSWIQKFINNVFMIPLALFGVEPEFILYVYALNLIYQFWIHTHVVKKMWKPVEWVFNTPSHHRVHHGRNPKYIDKNHGGVFIIWDRMFGTFKEEEEEPVYGVTTPTNSWNPLWANVEYWVTLYRQFKQVKGMDKLRIWFKPPGWRPDYLGGMMEVPEVERETYRKFETFIPKSLTVYAIAQFVLILATVSLFLNLLPDAPLMHTLLFALVTIWGVLNTGWMLEGRKVGLVSDLLRLPALIGTLLYLFELELSAAWVMTTVLVLLTLSAVGLGVAFSKLKESEFRKVAA